MIILDNLNAIPSISRPCVFAIGNFDGVHLGHQRLLSRMRAIAGPEGSVCILTFSNHPTFILPGKTPVKLITSKSLKLKYLSEFRADVVYCLEFTSEIAHVRYDAFIHLIRKSCPFDTLLFGEGDAFGYKREGTEEKMRPLADQWGFEVEYLPKVKSEEETISSKRIRNLIQSKELEHAANLLGHPFQIEVENGLVAPDLCLPPDGDYSVSIDLSEKTTLHLENGKIRLDPPGFGEKFFITFE